MAMYIVLLGPPGAGKGTQAKMAAAQLGLAHISSGDLFRENLSAKTELGLLAKGYMDRGELVPDDVTIAMVGDRLQKPDCANGALLDGFPRTPAQAQALEELLAEFGGKVDFAPYISVPTEVLIERMSGRWICRAAGHVYHIVYNPPKVAGVCDIDGSELYQREDDKPETVRHRIDVYLKQTAPLLAYYQDRGVLLEVDGTQSIEAVSHDLMQALGAIQK